MKTFARHERRPLTRPSATVLHVDILYTPTGTSFTHLWLAEGPVMEGGWGGVGVTWTNGNG